MWRCSFYWNIKKFWHLRMIIDPPPFHTSSLTVKRQFFYNFTKGSPQNTTLRIFLVKGASASMLSRLVGGVLWETLGQFHRCLIQPHNQALHSHEKHRTNYYLFLRVMWVWMFTRSLKSLLPEKDQELRIDFCAGREVGLLRMSLREVLPQLRTNESAQFPVELWIELNQHKNNLVMRRNEAADVQIGLRDTWGYYFQCLLTSPTAHRTPIAATAAPEDTFLSYFFSTKIWNQLIVIS